MIRTLTSKNVRHCCLYVWTSPNTITSVFKGPTWS